MPNESIISIITGDKQGLNRSALTLNEVATTNSHPAISRKKRPATSQGRMHTQHTAYYNKLYNLPLKYKLSSSPAKIEKDAQRLVSYLSKPLIT